MVSYFPLEDNEYRLYSIKNSREEKCVPSSLFRTRFLGVFSDYFTPVVEFRSYLHLFTKFLLKWTYF